MMDTNANSMSTQIPIPLVDPDKLPREKGWNYTEIASIVGNLYLESRKRVAIMQDEFGAIIEEYKHRMAQLEQDITQAKNENLKLHQELERRNGA